LLYRGKGENSDFASFDQNGLESEEERSDYYDCISHSYFDPCRFTDVAGSLRRRVSLEFLRSDARLFRVFFLSTLKPHF